jgi:flagellar basal-body rod protein FlgF
MIRGLYTAASGLIAASRRMEAVTSNLANTQTNGYKQERTSASSFEEQLVLELSGQANVQEIGPLSLTNLADAPQIDLGQGALQSTGRDLDLAVEGPGFFALQTASGQRYTRDGSFTRNAQGILTNHHGDPVLGENGPIVVPPGRANIAANGNILVDDQPVGRLKLVEFPPDQELKRVGQNQFVARADGVEPAAATGSLVHQGFVEASNVDLTGTMTTAIELQRAYEANQRMIQYQDDLTARAVSEIARPVA